MRVLTALSRPLMSGIFIVGGLAAVRQPGPRVEKAAKLGLPHPDLMVRASGAAMAVGGLSLLLGYRSRLAALGLLANLVPTTYAGHAFWEEDGPARAQQQLQFLKNLGLAGGLLALLGTPSPARARRVRRQARAQSQSQS
jgi:uncharacterized membrane protein YphA (DoxX/SURF4 family)